MKEIDKIVIAQADDESEWEEPIQAHLDQPAAVSIPAELAARAAFLARLHRKSSVHVVGECPMRTDISIPRPVSEAAEQMAQRLGISLSELYAEAIAAYVAKRQPAEVTALLDHVYAVEASALEPEIVKLQVASMGGKSW